MLIIPS